jgi:hypothetical protein
VGKPAEAIVRVAREAGVDLIVMGTHGRTGLRHLLLGSVAEAVIRQVRCPVTTVRSKVEGQPNPGEGEWRIVSQEADTPIALAFESPETVDLVFRQDSCRNAVIWDTTSSWCPTQR